MVRYPARWFQLTAVCSLALGVAMVFALNALLHRDLPLWLHIPLAIVVLTLLGGSALAAGVCFVEFNSRNQGNKEETEHS